MRGGALAVGVAVVVVLAGCPSTAGETPPTETVTPAPVPTAGVEYPPGVSERGVSGADLAAAHERALERTNYTIEIHRRIEGTNGPVQRTTAVRRVLAGGESYAGRYERPVSAVRLTRSTGTVEYWSNGEGFAVRQTDGDRLVYLGWSDGGRPVVDVDGSRSVNLTVRALQFGVTRRPNGSVALVVTGLLDRDALPAPAYVSAPRNVSGTVRVRADGLVTGWRVAYDATLGERTVRVVHEQRVRALGTTTIERPGWVDEARNRSGI